MGAPMKPRILVVDDDPNIATLVCDALEDQGFGVTYCTDAAQAKVQAEGMKVGLLILDIMMPHFGTGLDAYRELRKSPYLPKNLPIIFLTALRPEAVQKMIPKNDPMVRLLHKPTTVAKLLEAVTALTGDSLRSPKKPADQKRARS